MKESRIVFAYEPNNWHARISMLVLLQKKRRRGGSVSGILVIFIFLSSFLPWPWLEARPYRGMVDEEDHINNSNDEIRLSSLPPFPHWLSISHHGREEEEMWIGSAIEVWLSWSRCSGTRLRDRSNQTSCAVCLKSHQLEWKKNHCTWC